MPQKGDVPAGEELMAKIGQLLWSFHPSCGTSWRIVSGRSIEFSQLRGVYEETEAFIEVRCSPSYFYRKSLVAGLITGTASISDGLGACGSGVAQEPLLSISHSVIPLALLHP